MRGSAAVAALLLAPMPTDVQPTTPMSSSKELERSYGRPEPVDLSQIAYNGESYQRRNVRTRGVLGMLTGQYLSLSEGAATIVLLPMDANAHAGIAPLVGRDVDVTGVVRALPSQDDSPCRGVGPGTCDDPRLPLRPARQPGFPQMSISAFSVADRGTGMSAGRRAVRDIADTGLEAAAVDRKPVRAIGQFRGANLCGDLPPASRRDPADWVLLTSEGAVWVTGRRPEGRGFQLDPAYRTDTSRWLEVHGKVESSGDVRYLRASRITLVAHPADTEPLPCPTAALN